MTGGGGKSKRGEKGRARRGRDSGEEGGGDGGLREQKSSEILQCEIFPSKNGGVR